jgi:hypothetical protein
VENVEHFNKGEMKVLLVWEKCLVISEVVREAGTSSGTHTDESEENSSFNVKRKED